MEWNHSRRLLPNCYFRRSHQKQAIDYLEDLNGALRGYEIKWRETRLKRIGALSPIVLEDLNEALRGYEIKWRETKLKRIGALSPIVLFSAMMITRIYGLDGRILERTENFSCRVLRPKKRDRKRKLSVIKYTVPGTPRNSPVREVKGNLHFPLDITYHGCPRNTLRYSSTRSSGPMANPFAHC